MPMKDHEFAAYGGGSTIRVAAMPAIETHRAEALPLGFSPKIDFLEDAMAKLPTIQLPVTHHFAKGVYRRECFVPQGTLVTSKIHKTQHFFVILKGDAYVWDETTGWVHLEAGYCGITQPGTRRVIYAVEDTSWTTFHPTEETDPVKIEAAIIEPHVPGEPVLPHGCDLSLLGVDQ